MHRNINLSTTFKEKDRNYGLDFLKILATMLIVFHHYQQVTGSQFPSGINYSFGRFYFGWMVEFFFIVSGYVMHHYVSLIYDGSLTLKQWYIKRSSRLLPIMAVSVVVFEILTYFHRLTCPGGICYSDQTVNPFGSLITALGIQCGGPWANPAINNPTWYVSVLLTVYVMFYISTAVCKKWNCSPYYAYVFMVLLGCSIPSYGINWPFINGLTYRGIYCFFVGILLAHYIKKHGVSTKLTVVSISTVIIFMLILLHPVDLFGASKEYMLSFVFFPSLIILTETPVAKNYFAIVSGVRGGRFPLMRTFGTLQCFWQCS